LEALIEKAKLAKEGGIPVAMTETCVPHPSKSPPHIDLTLPSKRFDVSPIVLADGELAEFQCKVFPLLLKKEISPI